MIKNMNSEMTTNSQLSTTEPKKEKQKLNKQVEQEKSSDPFHRERASFRGAAGVWMRVDFLHGDKFFQHFYLHVPR